MALGWMKIEYPILSRAIDGQTKPQDLKSLYTGNTFLQATAFGGVRFGSIVVNQY